MIFRILITFFSYLVNPVDPVRVLRSKMKRDKLLPVSTVAQILTLSTQTIYNLIVAGQISAVRIGPRAGIRIKESELQRFLKVREYETGIESEYLKEIS